METPREITVLQAAIILISTIIGVGVLALPRIAVLAGDTGAPLITLLGILLAFFGLVMITLLGMRFPSQSLIRYSEVILGKPIARFGSIVIIVFFAVLTALTSREFGEVVITSVLRRTPLEVTVIVMLLLAVITTRNDITTFAYIHHFYSPLILTPVILIVILSLKNAEVVRLLPIWGNEPNGMFLGVLTVAALFQGFFILTMIIPAMRRPDRAMTASIWGMAIAGGLYLIIVIATLAVFGAEEVKLLLWPTLELAKTTSLPANILERLDAAFLAVWVTAVFTTLFSSYFLMIHAATELFQLRNHRMFSLFFLPFVFIIAMLPDNVLEMYKLIEIVGRFGLLITVVYPTILWMVALIRKKRGKSHAARKNR
ncbi:GerAB/ArcD/ProY family transporter [Ammoniphilus resinae]|uniref:Spore germination protein n=1 Tax=Ammoniphilus resinae TaxID=861532 RepID=A0ABS4GKC9_9BACL|nr:endospore germination permease [Ammoniphilus resinae]MBP1930562.1 spore germination protein [Ammoniphilus resinae]